MTHCRPILLKDKMSSGRLNDSAVSFRELHQPGNPLVVANVHDIPSAKVVAALPATKAIATASWAIAYQAGIADDDLDFDTNISAVIAIGKIAAQHNKPLTVDLQDGYGDRLEEAVKAVIEEASAVGINLEDYTYHDKQFFGADEAAERVKRVVKTATEAGVPDFAVNARCDILVHDGKVEEVVERGKKYLAAGATTVFVWAGARDLKTEEIQILVKAFDGRLSVLRGGSSKEKLAELGVARISVGPTLLRTALDAYKKKAEEILEVVA